MNEQSAPPKRFMTLAEIADARRLAPDIDPWAHYVIHELFRVTRDLEFELDRNMSEYGITMGRYVVLAEIYRAGREGISSSELADSLGVTRATITGLLDNLERDQFVERERRTDDKRRVDVRATGKARAYFRRILPDHCDKVARAMATLSNEEREQFIALLHKVEEGIHTMSQNPANSAA